MQPLNQSHGASTSNEAIRRTHRVEERGQLQYYTSQSFCLLFETVPIWLLALRPDFCQWIYIPTCNSLEHLESIIAQHKIDKTLYSLVIGFVGKSRFRFHEPKHDVLHLVSGSIPFLNEKSIQIGTKKGIFITDHHLTLRRTLPQRQLNLTRFKHSLAGGATTFEGVFGYNPHGYDPQFPPFKRKLGDFMDYSIPPMYRTTSEMVISSQKLAPIQYIHRLVHFPTHFSANGFGYRYLTSVELSKLFGFDIPCNASALKTVPVTAFPIVPIQVLDILLKPVLLQIPATTSPSTTLHLPPSYHDPGYTTLHHLNKRLPHSWYQHVQASSSAVKSDNASVDNVIWDNRILLLYPHLSSTQLNSFRKFLIYCLFKRLRIEFIQYLKRTYPNYWSNLVRPHNGGVIFSNEEQYPSFLKDLHVGRQVLRSYLDSSFMTWDGGSTLIFWRWPSTSRLIARDGLPPYQLHPFPQTKKRLRFSSQNSKQQILEKLLICLQKNYLELVSANKVQNYIDYFPVPKGEEDIRLVFNGTSCGINQTLFASNFWLSLIHI